MLRSGISVSPFVATAFQSLLSGDTKVGRENNTATRCSGQSPSRLPGTADARGSSAGSRTRLSSCPRPSANGEMFEPCLQGRELCHSCDLCGDLPILGVRWTCDVCDDFGACRAATKRLRTRARRSRRRVSRSRCTAHRGGSPPRSRAPRRRRERAIATRFPFRDVPKTRFPISITQ